MKEVKQATFEKREKANLDKFVDLLNKADEKKKLVNLIYKTYRNGVIFGDTTAITYLKDNYIVSARRDECNGLETLFEQAYKDLKTYEEASVEYGSTEYHKKALRFKSENVEAFVNEKIVGDIPKGSRFFIRKENHPVLIMNGDTIIKIVLPFVGVREFNVVEK